MPQLAERDRCTGCAACANACNHGAILMREDAEGFLRPQIDEAKCVECKLCEKVCPPLTNVPKGAEKPVAFALWSNQDRTMSSSGGAFSAFARYVLSKGGIVFGAAYDDNLRLCHVEADSIEGIGGMRGSKYMQSNIGDAYQRVRRHLKDGRWVLFTGTPCQVAGLRTYLRKDYETLLTLDLACHGVPSVKIFNSYLRKLENRLGFAEDALRPENYEFRRRNGWGKAPSVSTASSCRNLYGIDALYMEAFNASALFRESCYHCDYARLPRVGDCTIADFWGIGRYGTPFRHNTRKGVSLVLANTAKGRAIINELGNVFVEERALKEALIENHNLKAVSRKHPKRNEIVSDFLRKDTSLGEINQRYHLVDTSAKTRIKIWATKTGIFDFAKAVYDIYKVYKGSRLK